jgi:hypothetical protein
MSGPVGIPVIPNSVAAGAEVDVVTITAVNPSVGGVSGRLTVRPPKRQFTCTVGPMDTPAVRSIFYTHRCRWPVAIRDWGDYIFADEELAHTPGGSGVLAPLRRLVQAAPGTRFYHQRVLLPDESETPVVIKVNGTPLARGDWGFDNYGIADIPSAHAGSMSTITWSGRAFVPVCFMDNSLAVTVNAKQTAATEFGVQSIQQIRLEEIFEEELIDLMAETDDSA